MWFAIGPPLFLVNSMSTEPDFELIYKSLADVKDELGDAWLLQFRGQGFVSWLIKFGSNGPWSHSGMVIRDVRGHLMCGEVREFKGGRLVTLKSQVEKFPGQIDVFEPNFNGGWSEKYRPEKAAAFMVGMAGTDYGWYHVWQASLKHLPFVRLGIQYVASRFKWGRKYLEKCLRGQFRDAYKKDRPPFCSMAVDSAYLYGGGVDVIKNRDSEFTEPSDLAYSMFFEYRYTLNP